MGQKETFHLELGGREEGGVGEGREGGEEGEEGEGTNSMSMTV